MFLAGTFKGVIKNKNVDIKSRAHDAFPEYNSSGTLKKGILASLIHIKIQLFQIMRK